MERTPSSPVQTAKQHYSSKPRSEQINDLTAQWETICGAGKAFLEQIEENGESFPDEQLFPRVWVALAHLTVNMLGFDSESPFRDIESVSTALNDRLAVVSGRLSQNEQLVGASR